MSGFETVVRPVVFPNIRPPLPRVLPPEDDPEQGIATLGGSGGGLIDLTHSNQQSVQRQMPHEEQERTFDVMKVKQKNKDGSVNENNFVEVECCKSFIFQSKSGEWLRFNYAAPPQRDNCELTLQDQVRRATAAIGAGGG